MTEWTDKIEDVSYTSPSGKSFSFTFEDLEKETDLKTAIFTFIEKDGAYIQSLGRAGRRFPMVCIFAGQYCMDSADEFEAALEERGYGELKHPIYGTRKVVPTGTIKRTDKLVSETNQSIVEITFSETITEDTFPESSVSSEDDIESKLSDYEDSASADFADNFSADTASESLKGMAVLTAQKQTINDKLASIAKKNPSAWTQFQTTIKALENSIEKAFTKALNIARQVLNILKTPSRLLISLKAKLEGYTNLINQIISQFTTDPLGINNIKNQFASSRLVAFSALAEVASGIAITASKTVATTDTSASAEDGEDSGNTDTSTASSAPGFKSRSEAIEVAESLVAILEKLQDFQDAQVANNAFTDTGGTYEKLVAVVYASVNSIINTAFSLPTQRIITLDRDRQVIELVAELYGDLDKVDDFIQENNLTADTIELLPMGTEIVYYV
jgi:Mu-like prophage DNA circulation protein